MKRARRLAMVFAGLLALAAPRVSAGQHGGGGGHGFGGGHSSGGHSSHASPGGSGTGHGSGHSIGHAVLHIFGKHQKSASSAPLGTADSALVNAKKVRQPNPAIASPERVRRPHRGPGPAFGIGEPFQCSHRRHSGFGGCAGWAFPPDSFFWRSQLDCSGLGFFAVPFFFGGFSSKWYDFATYGSGWIGQDYWSSSVDGDGRARNVASGGDGRNGEAVTLLVLQDGSEFGLADYWLQGDKLHYVTNYGGENALPVVRIDLEKTVQLNAERGVDFVLRPRRARAPVAP